MFGDYIERYRKYNEAFLMPLEYGDEKLYFNSEANMANYNNYDNNYFNSLLLNKNIAYYDELFFKQERIETENNIYKKFSESSVLYNSSFLNNESNYSDYTSMVEKSYVNKELENSYFYDNPVNNSESIIADNSQSNKYYDYINTSDIKDSVSNSYTENARNINISLGGITQHFAGGENAENIAETLCDYLKKALGNSAEGVYF